MVSPILEADAVTTTSDSERFDAVRINQEILTQNELDNDYSQSLIIQESFPIPPRLGTDYYYLDGIPTNYNENVDYYFNGIADTQTTYKYEFYPTERDCLIGNEGLFDPTSITRTNIKHNQVVYNNHLLISELPDADTFPQITSSTECTYVLLRMHVGDLDWFDNPTLFTDADGGLRSYLRADNVFIKKFRLSINHTSTNFWEYPIKESINHGGIAYSNFNSHNQFPIDVDPALINRDNFFSTPRFTSDIVLNPTQSFRFTDPILELDGQNREFLCYNLPATNGFYPQDPQVISDLMAISLFQNQANNFTYNTATTATNGYYPPTFTGLAQSTLLNTPNIGIALTGHPNFSPLHDCIFFTPETTLDSFISDSYQLTKLTQFNTQEYHALSFNNTSSLKSYIGFLNYTDYSPESGYEYEPFDYFDVRELQVDRYFYSGILRPDFYSDVSEQIIRFEVNKKIDDVYRNPDQRVQLCNHADIIEKKGRNYHFSCMTEFTESMTDDFIIQAHQHGTWFRPIFLNDPSTYDKVSSLYDDYETLWDKLYATRFAPLNSINHISGINPLSDPEISLEIEIYLKRTPTVPITSTSYNTDSERLEFTFTSPDTSNNFLDNSYQYEVICQSDDFVFYDETLDTDTNNITLDIPNDLASNVGCSVRSLNGVGWSEHSNPDYSTITETEDIGIVIDDVTPFRPTLTVQNTTSTTFLAVSKAGVSTGAVLDDPASRLDNNFILNSNSSHYFTTIPTHFDLRCRVDTGPFMTLADNQPINLNLRYFSFDNTHFEYGSDFSCQWRDILNNQNSVWSELVTLYIDPILPPTPNPPRLTFSITGSYNDISASLNFPENNSGEDIDVIDFQCKDSGDPDINYYNYFTNEPVRDVLRFYTEPLASDEILECRYRAHNGVGWSDWSETATISPSTFTTPSQPILDLEVFLTGAMVHWSDVNTATPISSFDLQCLNDDNIDPAETLQNIATREPYDPETPRSFFWSESIGINNFVQCQIRLTNEGGFTSAWSDTTSATLVPLTITLTIKDETVGDITLVNATVLSNFHPIRIADQQWFVDEELIYEDLEQRVYTRPSFSLLQPIQLLNNTQLLEISLVGDHEGQEVTVRESKELTREYIPDYQDSTYGHYTVNYTAIRDSQDLHLKVNRGLQEFQIECNYFTETDPVGSWINHTNVYFYNEIYDAGFRTIHVTCYNEDELFNFISYFDGNHIQRFFSMIETEAFPSGILGVPLPVLFIIIIVAGLFSGSTSDVGSFVLLFAIGVFGFLGLIEVSPVVWAFMLLIGGISIFLGTRIRT